MEAGDQVLATISERAAAHRDALSGAHHEIVELVRYTLGFYGHEITEEAHAITPDGSRYFGLMSLKSPYGDYTDTLGLRNSHDKIREADPLEVRRQSDGYLIEVGQIRRHWGTVGLGVWRVARYGRLRATRIRDAWVPGPA